MTSGPHYPIALPEWSVFPGDEAAYPITDVLADGSTPFDLTALGDSWTVSLLRTLDGDPTPLDRDVTLLSSGKLSIDLTGDISTALSPRRGFGIAASDLGEPDYMVIVQVTGGPLDPVTPYAIPVRITTVGSLSVGGGAIVVRTGAAPGAVVVRTPGQEGPPGPPGASSSDLLPSVGSITYDGDGNVLIDANGLTYTYNGDGTVHTISNGVLTRTLAYNGDGTIASVA